MQFFDGLWRQVAVKVYVLPADHKQHCNDGMTPSLHSLQLVPSLREDHAESSQDRGPEDEDLPTLVDSAGIDPCVLDALRARRLAPGGAPLQRLCQSTPPAGLSKLLGTIRDHTDPLSTPAAYDKLEADDPSLPGWRYTDPPRRRPAKTVGRLREAVRKARDTGEYPGWDAKLKGDPRPIMRADADQPGGYRVLSWDRYRHCASKLGVFPDANELWDAQPEGFNTVYLCMGADALHLMNLGLDVQVSD